MITSWQWAAGSSPQCHESSYYNNNGPDWNVSKSIVHLFTCIKKNLKIHLVASAEAETQHQHHTTGVAAQIRPEKLVLQKKGGGGGRQLVAKATDDKGFWILCYLWNRGQSKVYSRMFCALCNMCERYVWSESWGGLGLRHFIPLCDPELQLNLLLLMYFVLNVLLYFIQLKQIANDYTVLYLLFSISSSYIHLHHLSIFLSHWSNMLNYPSSGLWHEYQSNI